MVKAATYEVAPLVNWNLDPYVAPINPYVALQSMSRSSMRTNMRTAALVLCRNFTPHLAPENFPYHKLTRAHLFDYYEFMRLNYASKTCNTNYSSIRSVMQQAVSMGLMTALEYGNAAIKTLPARAEIRRGRVVEPLEAKRWVKTCLERTGVSEDIKSRDALLFAILWYGGVRLSEALKIKITDVQWAPKLRILVDHAKGGYNYVLYPNAEFVWFLKNHMQYLSLANGDVYLLGSRMGRGIQSKALSRYHALDILQNIASLAGLQKLVAHDLRRSFVSRALDQRHSLVDVGGLVGHTSTRTTRNYDLSRERRMESICAADTLNNVEDEPPCTSPTSTTDAEPPTWISSQFVTSSFD